MSGPKARFNGSAAAKKVSNRELRRIAMQQIAVGNEAMAVANRASMILLVALHAQGGEIRVSNEQIEAVGRSLGKLDFGVSDDPDAPGVSIIRLVGEIVPKPEQAVQMIGGNDGFVAPDEEERNAAD